MEVVSEHLRAHRCAFSLSGSIWKHLEESVWLFRVAELFSYNFQNLLHCLMRAASVNTMTMRHQQQLQFLSETPGCSGRLWWLWHILIPSDGELHACRRVSYIPPSLSSAKCILVTGSVWHLSDQNNRVVKSQSLLDWCSRLHVHLEAPGSTLNHCRAVWEKHLLWECCWCAWKS